MCSRQSSDIKYSSFLLPDQHFCFSEFKHSLFLILAVLIIFFMSPVSSLQAANQAEKSASLSAQIPDFTVASSDGMPKLRVAVSILPVKYLLDRVGGEYVETVALLPAGADVHSYEPKPLQLVSLSKANIYFSMDIPFEEAWLPRFLAVHPKLKVVKFKELIAEIPNEIENTSIKNNPQSSMGGDVDYRYHDEHSEMHIWLSPVILEKISQVIAITLSTYMPDREVYFQKNYRMLQNELRELDEEILSAAQRLPAEKKIFMVYHPAWECFAQRYGLTQLAIEQDGKEPSPAHLAATFKTAREYGVNVMFVHREIDPSMAQKLVSQLPGGKVVVLDPMGYNCLDSIRAAAKAILGATGQLEQLSE